MMARNSRSGIKLDQRRQSIYVTEVEGGNLKVCGYLSSKSYGLLAACTFGALAYGGHEVIHLIAHEVGMMVPTAVGDVYDHERVLMEQNPLMPQIFYTQVYHALAIIHLLLAFTSRPVIFYLTAGLYYIGKWYTYISAVFAFYASGWYMLHFQQLQTDGTYTRLSEYTVVHRAVGILIFAIWCTAFGCTMSSVGDTYYQYAKALEIYEAQEEQKKQRLSV